MILTIHCNSWPLQALTCFQSFGIPYRTLSATCRSRLALLSLCRKRRRYRNRCLEKYFAKKSLAHQQCTRSKQQLQTLTCRSKVLIYATPQQLEFQSTWSQHHVSNTDLHRQSTMPLGSRAPQVPAALPSSSCPIRCFPASASCYPNCKERASIKSWWTRTKTLGWELPGDPHGREVVLC